MKPCLAALFFSIITWASHAPACSLNLGGAERARTQSDAQAHKDGTTDNIFALGGTFKETELARAGMSDFKNDNGPPDDIQLNENAQLTVFYAAPDAEEPDFSLRNTLVLKDLSTLTRFNEYLDPPTQGSTGEALRMTTLRDALLLNGDRSNLTRWLALYSCHPHPTSNWLQISGQAVSPASDLELGAEAKPAQFLSPLRQQRLDSARSGAKSAE